VANPAGILWLTQQDVIAAGGLDMTAAMQDVERVYRLHSSGEYVLPGKIVLWWEKAPPGQEENIINVMPAYLGSDYGVAGLKVIASFPQNPWASALPRATALIMLLSADTGLPLAIMDGTLISAMRTGAATGVAAKYLGRPGAVRAGLIGAGVQNRTQLMALHVAYPGLQRADVFDLHLDRAEAYAAEMSQRLGLEVCVAHSAEKAIREAELVVTATTSTTPIVLAGWLAPGAFYAHVSGYECEYEVIHQADKVVVDDWEQVKHRMASTVAYMWRDEAFSDEDLYAELGEVVAGLKPGREDDQEVIVFSPIGLGLHDLAVAWRIYQAALDGGFGQSLKLWDQPLWI
jgi:ornithine cyclodeaminase